MGHDRHQTPPVETWLAAEHRSDETAADTALQDLIRVLPAAVPPAAGWSPSDLLPKSPPATIR